MPHPITQAQPPLEFIAPDFNPLLYRVIQFILPSWMHQREKLVDVQTENIETLVDLYQQFRAGKVRFMLAFRHPSTNDPFCMMHLLSQALPKAAKQKGITLSGATFAHFVYDRGIPLWAGKIVGWLYAQLGCTPIRRGKMDTAGLRSIRQLFAEGQFPMAAAPEGATNGHNEVISPLEPGIAQFGFWCMDDLRKANRQEDVVLLPVGIQYHYVEEPWEAIATLLSGLEQDTGLPPFDANSDPLSTSSELKMQLTNPQHRILYARLFRLAERLLPVMEEFYTKFYQQDMKLAIASQGSEQVSESSTQNAEQSSQNSSPWAPNQSLKARLDVFLNTSLKVAEQSFGMQSKGDYSDRCRRLEQAAWDRIYREDLKHLETLSPVERGLADRIAEEANSRLWHMRIAETFVSVTGHYVIEKPTAERFAETTLLLWDLVQRLKGVSPFPRPKLGEQRAKVSIGDPLSIGDRWALYKGDRRQAVATLTQELQDALQQMIQ
jgi:hypothetical protein